MEAFVNWLAETPGSIALHESLYAYSFIEMAHVILLMLFVGAIVMVDLRLLGVAFRETPISAMMARVLPWSVAGFVVMIATGLALFYAIPVRSWHSVWFRVKLVLLVAGMLNIWLFHNRVQKNQALWDLGPTPRAAQVSAVVSLVVWATVIVMGRMIAYNWFDCDRPQGPFVTALAGCPAAGDAQ